MIAVKEWQSITRAQAAGFGVGAGLFCLLVTASPSGFVFLFDHANLLFHEAGHVFIGMLSARLEPYGGTLGQMLFPAVLAVSFWRRNQVLQFAAAILWLGENLLNIARYMADARRLLLPLVGGGDHDWNTIFGRWDVLVYDTRIAAAVRTLGWVMMLGACLWVAWRAWCDRESAADDHEWSPHGS
jgi:hypothetical protein